MVPYEASKKRAHAHCYCRYCPFAKSSKTAVRVAAVKEMWGEVPFHKPSRWEACHDLSCNCDRFCDCCLVTGYDWCSEEDIEKAVVLLMSSPLTAKLDVVAGKRAA